MSIAISTALAGVRANLTRMDASAARIAERTADPASELVEQIDIKTNFDVNMLVLETANGMERDTIRLWA